MTNLYVTTREGHMKTVTGREGATIMEILRESGFDDLHALCGGCCSCATCHIYVDDSRLSSLPPITDDENDLMDSSHHRRATSRLSCQIPWSDDLGGLHITIAPED